MVDEQRFEQVWGEYGASILRYCRFATGSNETGEDIAAETFARFLQHGERIPGDKLEAWLFTVARNQVRSHFRKAVSWSRLRSQPEWAKPVAVQLEHDSGLIEILRPLKPAERLAVYLRVIEGRPFAEVARITGKNEAAAKKTVYRALERLRRLQDGTASTTGSVEHG